MAIFPGEPGLASLIEAKDDGSGGDNWSYKTCKTPVKSSPPTPNVLQTGCPSCHPTNIVRALKAIVPIYCNAYMLFVCSGSAEEAKIAEYSCWCKI